jgi:hypothetical protein
MKTNQEKLKASLLDIYGEDQYNYNKVITFATYVGRMLPLGECSGVCFFLEVCWEE